MSPADKTKTQQQSPPAHLTLWALFLLRGGEIHIKLKAPALSYSASALKEYLPSNQNARLELTVAEIISAA